MPEIFLPALSSSRVFHTFKVRFSDSLLIIAVNHLVNGNRNCIRSFSFEFQTRGVVQGEKSCTNMCSSNNSIAAL